jgi:hypothetical protein
MVLPGGIIHRKKGEMKANSSQNVCDVVDLRGFSVNVLREAYGV